MSYMLLENNKKRKEIDNMTVKKEWFQTFIAECIANNMRAMDRKLDKILEILQGRKTRA